jgi:hypothetical protein
LSMTAYGGEANFAFPPRPENPATPWNIQWQVKVRYKSTTGGLLGQPMPFGAGVPGGGPPQGQPPAQGPGRGGFPSIPGLPGGLRGRIPGL